MKFGILWEFFSSYWENLSSRHPFFLVSHLPLRERPSKMWHPSRRALRNFWIYTQPSDQQRRWNNDQHVDLKMVKSLLRRSCPSLLPQLNLVPHHTCKAGPQKWLCVGPTTAPSEAAGPSWEQRPGWTKALLHHPAAAEDCTATKQAWEKETFPKILLQWRHPPHFMGF